ncbi:MAG: Flp pilus assembly complex ATPase component [candidate division Zixibacteria bacterium]|nr:Flp pilus assembly complex ATPase component [candidate division Zixibacteria bacterium]
MTGHLVLSTLHTNDAASAITRLINMNIEPYLIASSLSMVVAQRLVRLLCLDCKTEYEPSALELEKLGLKADTNHRFYAPNGCDKCLGTGYVSRSGVYEILPINDDISSLILNNAPLSDYRKLIHTMSYGLLKVNAIELLKSGQTSFIEISTL